MNDRLFIIGASGHGKVAYDIAKKMNRWNQIYYLDDDIFKRTSFPNLVVGSTKDIMKFQENSDFFVAIGDNAIREKITNDLLDSNLNIVTLIHTNTVISDDVTIGRGTIIMAGVVINTQTTLGVGCIVNTSSSIDHDNIIEDFVHISPGVRLAGNVKIGNKTWVGIGTIIINNINIHSNCMIGAGSLVINNIEKPGTYFGSPIKEKL